MLAYNHLIVFNPYDVKDALPRSGSETMIIFDQCEDLRIAKTQMNKWTFFNNQGRDIALYTDRIFDRTVKGQRWAFDVENVVTFLWESGSSHFCYKANTLFTPKLLEYWALHIVLPIYFTIEEKYDFLHAGAVEVRAKPVLFVAESFGGKSTMTDFFIQKGHSMISDDKVAVVKDHGQFLAIPSHPHHRPYRKMEDLGYSVKNMTSMQMPIHAIFELQRTEADAAVAFEELKGIEKFKSLRFSSEINLSFLKPARFHILSSLANSIPLYRVKVPWDLARLEEVYNAILLHTEKL